MRSEIDAGDIQAIAKTAFGSLNGARYLLLRVVDPGAARRWLASLAPTSVARLFDKANNDTTEICQIALTASVLGSTAGAGSALENRRMVAPLAFRISIVTGPVAAVFK